jgi:hypothetical protein
MRTSAFIAGLLLVGTASRVLPRDAVSSFVPAQPLPAAVYEVALLGRRAAAADLVWLRTIQLIGSRPYSEARYPHLEDWADVITALDPGYQMPPATVAVLLVTETDRAERVDALLARAEERDATGFYFPMLRGFVAYFGRRDLPAAAAHYERAGERGGPPYVKAFAKRLRTRALQCTELIDDLAAVARSDGVDRDALRSRSTDIVVSCFKQEIEHAATRFRLDRQASATSLQQLVSAGYLPAVPQTPAGSCWDFNGIDVQLVACRGPQ